MLVLDMIEFLPPLRLNKYDTWRILPVKCYINNSVCLWSFKRIINSSYIVLKTPGHDSWKPGCVLSQGDEADWANRW
jgi:hypothetical protein